MSQSSNLDPDPLTLPETAGAVERMDAPAIFLLVFVVTICLGLLVGQPAGFGFGTLWGFVGLRWFRRWADGS